MFKLADAFYLVLIAVTVLLLVLWRALAEESFSIGVLLLAYIPLVFLLLTGPIWLLSLLACGVSRLPKRLRTASPDANATAGAA